MLKNANSERRISINFASQKPHILLRFLAKRCPPVVGLPMQRTDLDTPLLTISSPAEKNSSRFIRITCSGILVITCTIFGFTQTYAQDVAAAARQEQARKQNEQKKPKHVYTDEDLKRAQILTPEDRAEVEAKKNKQPLPGPDQQQDSFDAQSLPAELPLGDVARRYRRMRELLQLQQSAEFHLPFVEEPVLAAPKPSAPIAPAAHVAVSGKHPVTPVHPVISIPAAPKIEPYHPPVKRSPFERPRILLAPSPSAPSHPPAKHVGPPQPPALNGGTLAQPSMIPATPSKPLAPAPHIMEMPAPRLGPHARPAEPAAPAVHSTLTNPAVLPGASAKPSAPAPDLRVMPSPKLAPHITPVTPSAPVVHGMPSHSFFVPASPVEPTAPKPDFSVMPSPRLAPHAAQQSLSAPALRATPVQPSKVLIAPPQPASPVFEVMPAQPPVVVAEPVNPVEPSIPSTPAKLNLLVVRPGDSLWKIAQEKLGKGVRWPELLAANPGIADPNHIVAGSQIYLPADGESSRLSSKVIVQKGDTLSQIAKARLGRASLWSCIAQANPDIHDANVIYEGESLVVPGSCKP